MDLRQIDDDILARIWHAAKYVSRRQAKLEMHLLGLPNTRADLDMALDMARGKERVLQAQVEALERARRERVAASQEVAGFEQPQWMWCQDAEYDQADRWLVFTGKGWLGVFKVVRRDEVPEGCPSVTIDVDWVLVVVEWFGKQVLPQTQADVLEQAAGVAAARLGVMD